MHPSRLVALGFFWVSVLLFAQFVVADPLRFSVPTIIQLVGAVTLLVTGLYGLVRHEENPIVTEWGPMAYLLVSSTLILIVGLIASLVSQLGS